MGTEDQLVAAAIEVFAERGYAGAGVAEIARRAGLTTGAIYSRYRGKADLLVAALDSEMSRHLESVFAISGLETPTEVLSALASHLLTENHSKTDGLFLEAVVAARHEPELAEMLGRALEDERMRVSKIIDEAKSVGLFDPAFDTQAVLTFIQSIGLGFTILRTIGTQMPERDAWQIVIDRVIASALPSREHAHL
jgi:AcrR family transcriptional regulator